MPAQTIVGKIKMIMQTDCAAQMRTWNLLCTSALISNAPGTEEQYLEKCLTTVLWFHNADVCIKLSSLNCIPS